MPRTSPADNSPALQPFRDAIRAAGRKVTPYRMGLQMGRAFRGAPEAPDCPYLNDHSVRLWSDGFRIGRTL